MTRDTGHAAPSRVLAIPGEYATAACVSVNPSVRKPQRPPGGGGATLAGESHSHAFRNVPVLWRPQPPRVEDKRVCRTAAEPGRHSPLSLPSVRHAIPYASLGSSKLEVRALSELPGHGAESLVGTLLQCAAGRSAAGGIGRYPLPLRVLPPQLRQLPGL